MQEGIYHDNFGGHAHPLVEQNRVLLARHNALVEVVAWERECFVLRNELRPFRNWPELGEVVDSYQSARAEVDRLIANESAK